MNDDLMKVSAPLYLLKSKMSCWKCSVGNEIAALACLKLDDGCRAPGYDGEVHILSYIEEIPDSVLHEILARHCQFSKRESRTAESTYYANTCLACGALFGDFYVQDEPGQGFFPTLASEAAQITIERLPLDGIFGFRCGYGVGAGDLIFEHGRRIGAA